MRPNDANGRVPTAERPFRVLILSGSDRRQYNCPGVDAKSRALMLRMAERLPQAWEIDDEDLGNVYGRARIQSCNACVSTAMALCCWPCNCYGKGDDAEPDLLWDLDLYARLDLADAWAILGPINWYAPSSNLKLLFDRLVGAKGKVEPGRWRAFGYEPPGHRWADAKLAWRDVRMRLGRAPAGSSPAAQEALGLNQDAVLGRHKSEGERLREG